MLVTGAARGNLSANVKDTISKIKRVQEEMEECAVVTAAQATA
jgi:hypothetical protein